MKKFVLFIGLVLCVLLSVNAYAAPTMSFSADVVTSSPQGSFTGKIYVDGDKVRMELPVAVTITRTDTKTAYTLMPSQKMYMEQAFDPSQAVATKEKVDGELERTLIGPDVVDGKPAKKYRVTYEANGIKAVVLQWMLDGVAIPVKTASEDGSWSMEYKNLVIGAQPAELFEVPGDYQKFSYGNMASMAGALKNAIKGR
jgi:hypothetical protein